MDELICAREGCGNPLPEARRKTQKFCCVACGQSASNGRRTYHSKVPERTCAQCGTPFQPTTKANIYCSLTCNITRDEERRREARNGALFGRQETVLLHRIEDVQEGEFAIYWADSHIPFADWPLMDAIGKVIRDFRPQREFIGGDIMDWYEISSFDKNPSRRGDLNDDRRQVATVLDNHKSLSPGMIQEWADGNHGDRLRRFLWRTAGGLYELRDEETDEPILSVPALLKLVKRGIGYYPFPSRLDYNGFIITHGPKRGGASKHCAKWMSEYVRSSGVCFHFHRNQTYSWAGDEGQPQAFYVIGCTCTRDPDYLPFPDWQPGFGYSRVINGRVHFTPVNVFDRSFQVEGRIYRY